MSRRRTRRSGPGRRLRVAQALALGLALAAPVAASAQETNELADVPAGPARIEGRVVHEARPEASAGVEIVLYALGADGQPGSRRTETDADGRFAFEDISNAPGTVYLLGARHAGLPFPGDRVTFEAGETERTVEVRISDPTERTDAVEVLQSSVRLSLGAGRLAVAEVHRLRNTGERVFHVPDEARARRRAPLRIELLPGAENFEMPLGLVPEGLVRDGRDVAFWGPLYPGEQEISFRYDVPVETGAELVLDKRFPSAAQTVRVFADEAGPLIGVRGLERGENVDEEGRPFRRWEATSPGAGFVATLELAIPELRDDPAALRLAESQLVFEVDDVVLRAQEQHRLEVDGTSTLQAAPGELLLDLPLPEAAEDVRFSGDAGRLGLVRTDRGVGLVGPLPPGIHGIGLAYTLRSSPDGVDFERRFDRRLPLLRAFVADTGVAVQTDRLHRRRPVRDADRTYLVLEAFEVEAGEPLHFSLRPLPPRAGSTGPALAAALVLAVAALGFLLAPLGRRDAADAARADDAEPDADVEAPPARREREQLYESIRDLDHDYETGKLDEGDWQTLRAELRGRAVALLAEERAARAAPATVAAEGTARATCAACGVEPRPGDRFCSGCGTRLAPPA